MINVVCAVIEDGQGRLLVCQRPEGKSLAGKWEFPGGKIEEGEQPEQALQREIEEELACVIEVKMALPQVEHHYSDFSIRLQPFMCEILTGAPKALEHDSLKWVFLNECGELDWAEADIPIWRNLIEPS